MRSAPVVRFMAFAIFFTGDFPRECSLNSRMSSFVQGRNLARADRFVAIRDSFVGCSLITMLDDA